MRLIFALVIFAFAPTVGYAAEFHSSDSYTLNKGETSDGDLYVGARTSRVSGNVRGDLVTAGGNVTVDGQVAEDLIAAGGNLSLNGQVRDDIRAAGWEVVVDGPVNGDLIVAGGKVTVMPGAKIGGDVVATGGEVTLNGTIGGRVLASGRNVVMNAKTGKNVRVYAQSFQWGENAAAKGSLDYYTPRAIAPPPRVGGEVNHHVIEAMSEKEGLAAVFTGGYFLRLAMLLACGALLVWVFRSGSRRLVSESLTHPGYELLRGLGWLVLAPIAVVLLFISVVGVPIGFLGVFTYAAFLVLGYVYAGIVLGGWLWRKFRKVPQYEITVPAALVGILVLSAFRLIPIVGFLGHFALILLVLGALTHLVYRSVRRRPAAPVA